MDSLDVAEDLETNPTIRGLGLDAGVIDAGHARSFPRARIHLQSGLPLELSAGEPIPTDMSPSRLAGLRMKRAMDVVISALALFALLPLFALVAIVIKINSPGPVLFRQIRQGLNGVPFGIYKFRTMDVAAGDESGVSQTVPGDKRVTAFGRLLRRTSIDELPQLLNVLLGQMSLVGPRPHVAGMLAAGVPYEELVPYYHRRLEVLPGLTGWAQVNGLRGPTDRAELARQRVDHDIAYVQNFSIWLDLKILAKTVQSEFLMGTGF